MSFTFAYTCHSKSTGFTARQTFRAIDENTARDIVERWNRQAQGAYEYALATKDGVDLPAGRGDMLVTRLLQAPFEVLHADGDILFCRFRGGDRGYPDHAILSAETLVRRTVGEPMTGRRVA